jgi:hypothetical protein
MKRKVMSRRDRVRLASCGWSNYQFQGKKSICRICHVPLRKGEWVWREYPGYFHERCLIGLLAVGRQVLYSLNYKVVERGVSVAERQRRERRARRHEEAEAKRRQNALKVNEATAFPVEM